MYIVYRDSNGIHMYMYMYLAFYGKQVFHLLVSFLFWMHTAYFILYSKEYIAGGYLFTDLLSLCHVVGILLCTLYNVCTPLALLQLLIWASYRHSCSFKDRLPEAICCCK